MKFMECDMTFFEWLERRAERKRKELEAANAARQLEQENSKMHYVGHMNNPYLWEQFGKTIAKRNLRINFFMNAKNERQVKYIGEKEAIERGQKEGWDRFNSVESWLQGGPFPEGFVDEGDHLKQMLYKITVKELED